MRVRRTAAVSLGAGLALSVRPAFARGGGTVVAGWSLDPLAIGTVLILDLAYLVGWYPLYVYADRPFGWTVLDDQRAAGLIMWVPTGWLYAAAILSVLMAWTQAGERGRPRQKGMPIRHVGR
jgi:cytochrome c oxidase assembly factor CtaG